MQQFGEKVDTQGIDFQDIAKIGETLAEMGLVQPRHAVAASAGNAGGIGGAVLTTVLNNPAILGSIIGFIKGLFGKGKPAAAPAPAPEPTPVPVPEPTPAPPGAGNPTGVLRRVAKLTVKYMYFQEMLVRGTPTKFGKRRILNRADFEAILANSDPRGFVGLGYRLHVDITPWDQFGKPFTPGDPDNDRLLLIEPSLGPVEANNRIRHNIIIDGTLYGPQGDTVAGTPWDAQDVAALTSEYDDYACTPVLTISQDLPLGVLRTLAYRPDYEAPDGTVITGPTLGTIRVKPWQIPTADEI